MCLNLEMQPSYLSSVPRIRYDGNYLSDKRVLELSSLSLLVFSILRTAIGTASVLFSF